MEILTLVCRIILSVHVSGSGNVEMLHEYTLGTARIEPRNEAKQLIIMHIVNVVSMTSLVPRPLSAFFNTHEIH